MNFPIASHDASGGSLQNGVKLKEIKVFCVQARVRKWEVVGPCRADMPIAAVRGYVEE